MARSIHRRRFIASMAGMSLLPVSSCQLLPVDSTKGDYTWTGIGFGIEMSMEIHGVSRALGQKLGKACEREIAQLEESFSLYLEESELSQLNREKSLVGCSDVFIGLLMGSLELEKRTLGYYQPAIHGAWQWLGNQKNLKGLQHDPQWMEYCEAMELKYLEVSRRSIRLRHSKMALSMNAIGQGFLADRVAEHIKDAGVSSAMLHLGETIAIGHHPSGRPWRLAVAGSDPEGDLSTVELADSGLAVSSVGGDRRLIDPVAKVVRQQDRTVAVISEEGATVADAFATAYAVAPEEAWGALFESLKNGGSCQVHIWEKGERRFKRVH